MSFIFNYYFPFLYVFREYILLPIIDNSLGYNYYRHNVYDVLSEEEIRSDFRNTSWGTFQFYFRLYFQKIGRFVCFYIMYFALFIQYYTISFIIIQQSLLFLILFKSEIEVFSLLSLFIILTKMSFLLSYFTSLKMKLNLKETFKVEEKSFIVPNSENAKLMVFWSIRTLEERDEYIRTLYFNSDQYMREKVDTHKLKETFLVKTFTNKELIKNRLTCLILILLFFFFKQNVFYENDTLEILFGFLSKNSLFIKNHLNLTKLGNHKVFLRSREMPGNQTEITFEILSSSKDELSNQGRVPLLSKSFYVIAQFLLMFFIWLCLKKKLKS